MVLRTCYIFLLVMIFLQLLWANAFVKQIFCPCPTRTSASVQIALVDRCPFNECWKADTWSVNPLNDTNVDVILQRLCSPAPHSYYVLNRALHLHSTSVSRALSKCGYLLKPGHEFQVDGECDWRIAACLDTNEQGSEWSSVVPDSNCMNAVEIARKALDKAISASERQQNIDEGELNSLVQQAKDRLSLTLGTDIRGRASADAAFAFCMAGVVDGGLYETLATVASLELHRVGQRPSFQSKYVLQMVEKLAASGWRDNEVYRVAADCLAFKGEHIDIVGKLHRNEIDLLATRPLLWLWRFSARQRKIVSGRKRRQAPQNENLPLLGAYWVRQLDDPMRPLVVDVGCGMGVSIMGLATMDQRDQDSFNSSPEGKVLSDIEFGKCNFVGGDLSRLSILYGKGIITRWELHSRLQFVCASAADLLESVELHYHGNVGLIMMQFPTPFQSQLKEAGNTQLPSSSASGFMVSVRLLKRAANILRRCNGFLLLQSNCEDVAVMMRAMAEDCAGFECVSVPNHIAGEAQLTGTARTPQRTLEWIHQGGPRAVGDGWSAGPLLPSRGATETEISCRLNETPIHRCLLKLI